MDTVGKDGARVEISAIKVVAPRVATNVIDRAIQVHGGAGVSQDTPLAEVYAHARTPEGGAAMAQKASGYGRKWKKWLAIYVAVGAVAYLIVFLVFFHHGGGGGAFHY